MAGGGESESSQMVQAKGGPTDQPGTHRVFLGLGSNLGDRRLNLQQAVQLLGETMKVERLSSVYDTTPMLVVDQPRFLNLVCLVTTELSPEEVLLRVKTIEHKLGRVAGPRFGPRLIDIDLLLYDELILESPSLTLPHPRMPQRAFVLLPLSELVPTLRHPVLHTEIAALAQAVPHTGVDKLGPLFSPTT
jgi:2-amino-4-hydroxy-6-hydroxymethyldihydropteridine diphosphokinase